MATFIRDLLGDVSSDREDIDIQLDLERVDIAAARAAALDVHLVDGPTGVQAAPQITEGHGAIVLS